MKPALVLCLLAPFALGCRRAAGESGGLTLEQKLPAKFAALSNVVELQDGRVAFADTKAKLFFTADLKSGKVDTLGTRVDSLMPDAPPEQYKFPGWVSHLGRDTIALKGYAQLEVDLGRARDAITRLLPRAQGAADSEVFAGLVSSTVQCAPAWSNE